MSLINDALQQAENAKLDKLSESETTVEIPVATYGQPKGRKLLGPITVVCLLLIGGGLVAYRYLGPGDAGPQAATADSKAPAPSVAPVAPAKPATPTEPEVAEWINPAFKDLTPEAANAMRARIADSIVKQFFDTGNSLNAYAISLSSPRPVRAKPPVKIAKGQPSKPPVVSKAKPTAAPPKPVAAPPDKPKTVLSAAAAGVDPTKFHVNGIMFNGPNSMAIINEGVYRIGQKVSGAVVENITPSVVVLRVGDKTFKVGM
jgi:hypothetical protein